MKLERTLEIGSVTVKITMDYEYETINSDGNIFTTKNIIKLVHADLYSNGELKLSTTEGFIYISDDKVRFGNVYITLSTGEKIIDAIQEMHEEMAVAFNAPAEEGITASEMTNEEAQEILEEVKTRKTEILSRANENKWRVTYNNINNEGGEGYVPNRATLEDVEKAKQILSK